ncbi:MAG TPA: hypothetical protein VF743_02995 [Acidimicrobiales bacterium]
MTGSGGPPRAEVVLVVGDHRIPLGSIDGRARCDLGLLDGLLRLRLSAGRMGASIRLLAVDDDLRSLIELVGLTDWLGA